MGTITIFTILHVGTVTIFTILDLVGLFSMLIVEHLSACGPHATAIYALSLSTTSSKPSQVQGTASACKTHDYQRYA